MTEKRHKMPSLAGNESYFIAAESVLFNDVIPGDFERSWNKGVNIFKTQCIKLKDWKKKKNQVSHHL